VQIKWVAPTALFVELGAEAFRGSEFPAAGASNSGTGSDSAFGTSVATSAMKFMARGTQLSARRFE